MNENIKRDDVLYGKLKMRQPDDGPKINIDTILISAFARLKNRERVLELGSAHGAVSMILALRYPRVSGIKGLEIQEDLVRMSRLNLRENGLDSRVDFIQGDLRKASQIFNGQVFDVIVSNPPYFDNTESRGPLSLSRQVANHESECSLSEVLDVSGALLKNKGRLYLIMKTSRLAELFSLLRERKLEPKIVRPVYPSRKRSSTVSLVYSCKGAGKGMEMKQPLYVYNESGEYSRDFLDAYTLKECPCL